MSANRMKLACAAPVHRPVVSCLTIDDTGVFLNFSIRKIKRINRYANELERQVKPLADLLIDFIQFYFFLKWISTWSRDARGRRWRGNADRDHMSFIQSIKMKSYCSCCPRSPRYAHEWLILSSLFCGRFIVTVSTYLIPIDSSWNALQLCFSVRDDWTKRLAANSRKLPPVGAVFWCLPSLTRLWRPITWSDRVGYKRTRIER